VNKELKASVMGCRLCTLLLERLSDEGISGIPYVWGLPSRSRKKLDTPGPSVPYKDLDSVSLVLQIGCKTYQGRGKIKLEDGRIRIGRCNGLSAEI